MLNTLIIYKFLRIAKRRQKLKRYSLQYQPQPSTATCSDLACSLATRDTELSTARCPAPVPPPALERQISRTSRRRSLQSPEERMLVLVLISIVILFVCCTTPAAILSIIFSDSLNKHLGFQIFRAIANNLELLNFALNFYIYCLCSAEIRRAFVSTFQKLQQMFQFRGSDKTEVDGRTE